MMWFFGIKKKGKRSIDEESVPKLSRIVEHSGLRELHKNDEELRVWLPEECKQALDEVVGLHRSTGARYLREFFVVYLYGVHELLRMRAEETGLYYYEPQRQSSDTAGIRYSRVAYDNAVPGLGKNIIPIKLFLPEKIKNDLQQFAAKAGVPLSTFARELLISHLLGHALWQERLRSWSPEEETTANDWEEGKIDEVVLWGFNNAEQTDESLQNHSIVQKLF